MINSYLLLCVLMLLSCCSIQFKVLMEHLDPDEEDEEGEASASANIRNKAINALLGGSGPLSGPSPRNQAGPETDDDDSDGDERTPGVRDRWILILYSVLCLVYFDFIPFFLEHHVNMSCLHLMTWSNQSCYSSDY